MRTKLVVFSLGLIVGSLSAKPVTAQAVVRLFATLSGTASTPQVLYANSSGYLLVKGN